MLLEIIHCVKMLVYEKLNVNCRKGRFMKKKKKLPIGIDNFEKIRKDDFYYVDKTKLIEQLLDKWGEANLFTRPRRFGKSLNMSMLKHFFEIGTDKTLFDGLYIADNKELCETYMGKFPVVAISLKGISANSYEGARKLLGKLISEEARRLSILETSNRLDHNERQIFQKLLQPEMGEEVIAYSIRELTELLEKHYGEKVIVLIDEYDVPLAKANEQGYYDEMVFLMRNLFENALKTNDSLKFAVLTGCLRVAKESIFTGLNNFKIYPITKVTFDESFGFTDEEVKDMLHYYGQDEHYDTVKEWYDGYRFGNVDVYCPWDVINYCEDHQDNPKVSPQNYWINTSGNDVIRHFIEGTYTGKELTKTELGRLVNGGAVQKKISQELTYKDLYNSAENIWSALFMTGYLTRKGEPQDDYYNLVVPNREIRNIITEQIMKMFKENVKKDGQMVDEFCDALKDGKAETVERLFTEYMKKTISIRDTFVRKPTKENFYHGILLGILSFKDNWIISSNKESGDGFSDVTIEIDENEMGIIIEVKYSEGNEMEKEGKKALAQIEKKHYEEIFEEDDIHKVLKYAIICNRKKCKVFLREDN